MFFSFITSEHLLTNYAECSNGSVESDDNGTSRDWHGFCNPCGS
jgi:hypothetical protein